MPNPRLAVIALAGLALLLWPSSSPAQIYEAVGIRAQGMGGAFVAVADDATATWWNPAGLATGAYFSAVFERSRARAPAEVRGNDAAWRTDTVGISAVFPALGLSYYRLRVSEIRPLSATADAPVGRQDLTTDGVDIRSAVISQYGVSVGQSLGDHVVLASTLKLVRGGQAFGGTDAANPLDQAAQLKVPVETHTDLDVGAMASLPHLRLGLSVKHVREPAFGKGENRFELTRQARVGAAILGGRVGPISSISGSFDADLTAQPTADGDVRYAAVGGEAWLFERHIGVRGGLSTNTVADEPARSASVGVSVAVQSGLYVDGAAVLGSDRGRRGWAIGGRVTF